ncbi:hypothetical protein C8J56DRAFT_1025624 [Mycena floridula]|nr:hypothetical protein C8J56DRAFT_1025624 [Mycena floridula]
MLFTTITVAFLCASFISAIPVQSSGYDASRGFYGDGTINPQQLSLPPNRSVLPPAQADQRNSKSKTPDLAVPAQASGSSSSSRKGAKELSSSARKKPDSQSASKGKDRATSSSTLPPAARPAQAASATDQRNRKSKTPDLAVPARFYSGLLDVSYLIWVFVEAPYIDVGNHHSISDLLTCLFRKCERAGIPPHPACIPPLVLGIENFISGWFPPNAVPLMLGNDSMVNSLKPKFH